MQEPTTTTNFDQSSAVALLINHPALIGFDSPSRMLVTCIKELFEVVFQFLAKRVRVD
jgi:hypothetical protein